MNNLDELKAIWQAADTRSLPQPADMMLLAKKHRNKTLRKKIAAIVIALALALLMCSVMWRYKSLMLTTRVGEIFMLLAAIILAGTNLLSIGRYYKMQPGSNRDFIQFLKKTRQNQFYFFRRTQQVALSFVSIGLLLYIYEAVYAHIMIAIVSYSALIVYLLVMWLVVRPRVFKKQTKKLNALIKQTETLINQLN